MPTMQQLPPDAPLMLAWKAYQVTEDYANSFQWAAQEKHRAGSMWAAFMAGWLAAEMPPCTECGKPRFNKGILVCQECWNTVHERGPAYDQPMDR